MSNMQSMIPISKRLKRVLGIGVMGLGVMGCLHSPPSIQSLTQGSVVLPQPVEAQPSEPKLSEPKPLDNGDYQRSPQVTWQAVVTPAREVECRMSNWSYEELVGASSTIPLEIETWSIVGTLQPGQRFEINLGPAGFGIVYDTQQNPWMFVKRTLGNDGPSQCFVRANRQFVQPIQVP
ncbi:MAG: hypothetical protein ACRC8A_16450 [Microcoleaceae cyanobacterium]